MEYEDLRRATREDALSLGVSGSGQAAQAERAAIAQEMVDEFARRQNVAYEQAAAERHVAEPYVPEPFGPRLVAEAHGDLHRVLASPQFEHAVMHDMGLTAHQEYVHDEDGERYESFVPQSADYQDARDEVDRIRGALTDRNDLGPTDPAHRLTLARERLTALRGRGQTVDAGDVGHTPAADLAQLRDRLGRQRARQTEDQPAPAPVITRGPQPL